MTGIGLPVPPGFTITTTVCDQYYKLGEQLPANLMDDVSKNIRTLERELKKGLVIPRIHFSSPFVPELLFPCQE